MSCFLDSGASAHMSVVRKCFSELTDKDVNVDVELGDDRVVKAIGGGTVSFQRESRPPLRFQDVYYVPGLKKNLISVSTLRIGDLRYGFVMEDSSFSLRELVSPRPK